jgi:predicted ATPase
MIEKLLIEGIRTHEHTEIELSRLTCLVGPNGSGKSTVLAVLGGNLTPGFERADLKPKIQSAYSNGKKRLGIGVDEGYRAVSFRLNSDVLRSASIYADTMPSLDHEGKLLAAVLTNWKLADDEKFEEIIRELKRVVPHLDRVRPTLTVIGRAPGFELLFDFRNAPGVSAQAVSEGTLFALGILTALSQSTLLPKTKTIVLLDDIDRGLHPDAQVELIKIIRQLAEQNDFQVIMTTHSPYVVDALTPEEVVVFALDATGTTRARRLNEMPDAAKFRGILSTGELWSANGESWVLQEMAETKAQAA